jgi:NADPH-dependent ferric siderophore reductase
MTTHQITRVRRETRRRILTVTEVQRLTPGMQRIRFTSPELHDFVSGAPDDHIKLIFPEPAADSSAPAGVSMRDYTPRAYDADQRTLTIDFVLHEAGPATAWARGAKRGDTLEIGGPRGSSVVTDDFAWYLLIGDETALPAIGRRVEELRSGVPVTTLVIINDAAEEQIFATDAVWNPLWVHRAGRNLDDADLFQQALAAFSCPPGDGYIWIAAEAITARAVRRFVLNHFHHPKEWLKAAGYWREGEVASHEKIED